MSVWDLAFKRISSLSFLLLGTFALETLSLRTQTPCCEKLEPYVEAMCRLFDQIPNSWPTDIIKTSHVSEPSCISQPSLAPDDCGWCHMEQKIHSSDPSQPTQEWEIIKWSMLLDTNAGVVCYMAVDNWNRKVLMGGLERQTPKCILHHQCHHHYRNC